MYVCMYVCMYVLYIIVKARKGLLYMKYSTRRAGSRGQYCTRQSQVLLQYCNSRPPSRVLVFHIRTTRTFHALSDLLYIGVCMEHSPCPLAVALVCVQVSIIHLTVVDGA